MSAQPSKIPSYRLHKASGLGIVTINGKDVYLGEYNTPESLATYGRVMAEYLATGRAPLPKGTGAITVKEMLDRYRAAKLPELVKRDQKHTEPILSAWEELYGETAGADFGPVRFEALRAAFVAKGWSRNYVNSQAGRAKQILRWLVTRELFPADKLVAIRQVPDLRAGQSAAPERKKIVAVPVEHVEKTLKKLPRPLQGLVLFQMHTGCRPGEAVIARRCDISKSGIAELPNGSTKKLKGVWVYVPPAHKNTWRGHRRYILIGPKGQKALADFVAGKDLETTDETPAGFLFQPGDVEKAHRGGEHYTVQSYGRAITKAAKAAGVPHWHPYQLRHAFAGKIRDLLTSEHAKEALGHKHLSMTDHYTDVGIEKAAEAVRKAG